jgi:hypothetical protein
MVEKGKETQTDLKVFFFYRKGPFIVVMMTVITKNKQILNQPNLM